MIAEILKQKLAMSDHMSTNPQSSHPASAESLMSNAHKPAVSRVGFAPGMPLFCIERPENAPFWMRLGKGGYIC